MRARVKLAAAALLLGSAATALAGSELADLTEAGADGMGPTSILLDYGDNPISAEAFASYVPPPGYLKNTPRTPQFNAEETLSSPGEPEGVVTIVTTPDGYTWKIIARTLSANWPYDPAQYPTLDPPPTSAWDAAFRSPTPPAGVVRYSANEKNQLMTFWATEGDDPGGAPIARYFVEDQWGNRHMMMATGATSDEETRADFEAAVLPAGWKKWIAALDETITLSPAYGAGDQAQYNVWRDSADNSYVQIHWSADGGSIAQQIAGMPIWGGPSGDRLVGTDADDVIHGAEGDDTILPLAGDDDVWGDAGFDTAVLAGRSSQFEIVSASDAGLAIAGPQGTVTLHDVEQIRFDDRTCRPTADRLCALSRAGRLLPILRRMHAAP